MSSLSRQTFDRLRRVSTATLTTQLFKRGLRNAFMQGVRPLGRYAANLVGPAFTLRGVVNQISDDNIETLTLTSTHENLKITCPAGSRTTMQDEPLRPSQLSPPPAPP